jgi:hypothetical protein
MAFYQTMNFLNGAKDFIQAKTYEPIVLQLMNQSKTVFPEEYSHAKEQPHGEADFTSDSGIKFDAKLLFSTEQCKYLAKGDENLIKWMLSLRQELWQVSEMLLNRNFDKIYTTRLYKEMRISVALKAETEYFIMISSSFREKHMLHESFIESRIPSQRNMSASFGHRGNFVDVALIKQQHGGTVQIGVSDCFGFFRKWDWYKPNTGSTVQAQMVAKTTGNIKVLNCFWCCSRMIEEGFHPNCDSRFYQLNRTNVLLINTNFARDYDGIIIHGYRFFYLSSLQHQSDSINQTRTADAVQGLIVDGMRHHLSIFHLDLVNDARN